MLITVVIAALAVHSPVPVPLAAEVRAHGPGCAESVRHCVGLRLFVATEDGRLAAPPEWLGEQIAEANRHFAPIAVGFELTHAETLDDGSWRIDDRAQRDRLGRLRFERGVIDVFVVARLADVDIEGEEIRGVHWRDRADRSRRWIILSAIAGPFVLAHELGHYFGLPHSAHRGSLMNKAPDHDVPWQERTFVAAEQRRMRARLRAMLGDGTLVARPPPSSLVAP